ncbi:hypothetical protein C7Y72_00665 [Paraconexibacter algicola]|uniref:Glycosyltransferase RgtA/B/C/D-like domain-containing protein n=2 Tax=Paraconexibacter algicola TaxID=2133960 RepID=A0A2T4UG85_9ACTN|nr:hypothetical protein C7Y72_00665 [Paraconexibacter algicola]
MKALLPAMLVPPALAAALLVLFRGDGFPNYDTEYALLWGRDIARLDPIDTGAFLSPTPHPLANLAGALLAPLDLGVATQPYGTTAESIVTALAFLWLGVLGYLVYRLGERWAGPAAGILAAAIVLTREPVLSFGVRAYVDIPFVCLVLAAILRETRRPRDGAGVLVLLALAGLIRPEAWLLAAGYLAYLWWPQRWATPRLALLAVLATAGPVLWALHDLLLVGDPLYSLTGTQDNAEVLQRRRGFADLPLYGPRRLGEIAREPVLLGAALGLGLAVLRLRAVHAVRVGLASLLAAAVAFGLLAGAGLPIITRYLLLTSVLLALFAAVALVGVTRLPAGDRLRRPAYAGAVATATLFVAFGPGQVDRIDRLRAAITTQTQILADLRSLTEPRGSDPAPITRGCGVAVPNQRAVPQLALWLDAPPSRIVVTQRAGVPPRGVYVVPASADVARRFVLDPRDERKAIPRPPADADDVARNGSWSVSRRCP